jgi:hypothetical protein
VSEFVQECLREWRRLGVPDAVASEMAADLSADLEEAEAEGGSPEDVLGNNAFDPRRFAAAWAVARGVTSPPAPEPAPSWRPYVAIQLSVLLGVLAIVAAVVLAAGARVHSASVAVKRIGIGPGVFRLFGPGSGRAAIAGPLGPPFIGTQVTPVGVQPAALLILIVAVVGLGVLALLYWSPRFSHRRNNRDRGPRTPSWS